MNIAKILQDRAEKYPQIPAIIDPRDRIFTFSDLNLRASRAATLLQKAGIQPGDGVLVFQPMSAELYIALIAIFQLGAIAIFLDPSAGKEHIERCCQLYPPKGLIASSKAHLLRLVSPALRQISLKFSIGLPVLGATPWQQYQACQPNPQIYPATPETPALLTFTSGSTGTPKAAIRTHGFLLAQHQALETSLKLKPGEIDLTTLPIFALANLASGVTSLIPNADLRKPGAIQPAKIIRQIQTYKPQSTAASPAFLERLAEDCDRHFLQLPNFTKIFTGGAPVFPRLLARLQHLAPQAEISAVYGSTEAEPIAHIQYNAQPEMPIKGLLAGKPVPEIQLRILEDRWGEPLNFLDEAAFEASCLPTGEVGEIVVSGNHVLSGYLHGVGDAETKFNVGKSRWHRTGDAGYLDPVGNLWLLGRCSACIRDEYGILYPFAVECIAYQYPEVRRVAVVSHRGKRVLIVETQDLAVLPELEESLSWANIAEIQVCSKIPVDRRHNAKIDYPALQRWLEESKKLAY